MMEGRAGYFPLALEAAMTHMQESCTLPKGFYTRCLQTTRQEGKTISLLTRNHPFQAECGAMFSTLKCYLFYIKWHLKK